VARGSKTPYPKGTLGWEIQHAAEVVPPGCDVTRLKELPYSPWVELERPTGPDWWRKSPIPRPVTLPPPPEPKVESQPPEPKAAPKRRGPRPLPVPVFEEEMRRRAAQGALSPTMAQEAAYLVRWWRRIKGEGDRNYSAKTVENRLGKVYRGLNSGRK
jgi:hypothetical protein